MTEFQRFLPAPDDGKDAVWISNPGKGLEIFTDESLPIVNTALAGSEFDSGTRDRRGRHRELSRFV